MKKTNYILASIIAGTFALASTPAALAVAQLRISDGTTTVDIDDNAAGDSSIATLGAITYIGAVGVFSFTLDSSLTKPVIGSTIFPKLDTTFNITTTGAGVLTIEFSDNDFTAPAQAGFLASFGGTMAFGSSLVYTTYGGNSNGLLDESRLLTTQSFGGGAVSGSQYSSPVANVSPFSLTQKLVITATGAGQSSSGDAKLETPDGGTTAALLGLALIGLAGMRRKFTTTVAPV